MNLCQKKIFLDKCFYGIIQKIRVDSSDSFESSQDLVHMELNSLVGPRIKVWEIILSLKIESFIAHMIAFVSDKWSFYERKIKKQEK